MTTDNGSETEDEDEDEDDNETQGGAQEEGSSPDYRAAPSDEDRPTKVVWEVVTSALSPDSHGFVSPGSGGENSYEDEDTADEEEEEGEDGVDDEWENDDDLGYVIVTLSEEEFIELEMVFSNFLTIIKIRS